MSESRNEKLLNALITGNSTDIEPPQSRVEELLNLMLQNLPGGVSQIANLSIPTDLNIDSNNKLQLREADGTTIGTGVTVSTSDVSINDTTASSTTTYSSDKIEDLMTDNFQTIDAEYKKKTNYYTTLSDLKADTSLKAGMICMTSGYYTINDGGGAEYVICTKNDSDTDDGGSIIVIGSLTAKLIASNEIRVEQFGVNDSLTSTEWTTKMNNIISYCKSNAITLTCRNLKLVSNVSFRNVPLKITGTLTLNGNDVELGGNIYKNYNGQANYSFDQFINAIYKTDASDSGKVYIRGCCGIGITINYYIGTVYFRVNNDNTFIAYSKFTFNCVHGLDFDIDTKNADGTDVTVSCPWINENEFYLIRSLSFIVHSSIAEFDFNRIHGGCFEGNYNINLGTATNNTFYDIRFEGSRENGSLIFGKGTAFNTFYICGKYHMNYTNNGNISNVLVNKQYRHARLINIDTLDISDVKANRLGRFNKFVMNTDNTAFKIDSSLGTMGICYETPFISEPEKVLFICDNSFKVDNGFCCMYKLYDANFVEISPIEIIPKGTTTKAHVGFYMNTLQGWKNGNNGFFLIQGLANCTCPMTDSTAMLYPYGNKYVMYAPTAYWDKPYLLDDTNKALFNSIKYVKFFIIKSTYFNQNDSEFGFISAKIYKIGGINVSPIGY